MPEKIIAIFGTSKARPGDGIYETAVFTGQLLAENGFAIANGGYGGTMEAAAKGAADKAGKIIGITCSAFKNSTPNQYITEQITTGSLAERLQKLIDIAAGYIVLPGATGTLLELAEVWELKNKGFLNSDKPIILIGKFWKPLTDLITAEDANSINCLTITANAYEAIEILKKQV